MNTAQVPEFHIAKVGKDRRRKGAGVAWFGGAKGGGGFSGALGGAGASAGGGMSLGAMVAKGMMVMLVSFGIGAGAWHFGSQNPGDELAKPDAKIFSDKGGPARYDDLSGVIRAKNTIPNSLGFVSGSADGLTPEERARRKAAEDAKRAAEEEAARMEEEQAAKDEEAADGADGAPGSSSAGQGMAGGNPFSNRRFGKLGSFGGGGGLAGGAGMSGGLSGNLNAQGGGLKAPPAQSGKLSSMRRNSRASYGRGTTARGAGKTRGIARRQLGNLNGIARHAMATGKADSAASAMNTGFDNANPAAQTIEAPGAAAQSGGGVNPGTNPQGGPIGGGSGCGEGQAVGADGGCSSISKPSAKNAAKNQNLIDMAKMIMMAISIIALIALVAEKSGPIGAFIAKYLETILYALGGVLVMLGGMILASGGGDKMIGGIVMAIGAFTIATAYFAKDIMKETELLTKQAAGALIANAVGALAVSSMSKPSAWQ